MKGMGLKKGLSAVLCGILLVTSLGLSDLGSVKVYAVDPTTSLGDSVTVTLSKTPVSGQSTAISDFSVSTSDPGYTVSFDGGWVYSEGSALGYAAGATFYGAKSYGIKLRIEANEGYYFPNASCQQGSMNVSVTNGCSSFAFVGDKSRYSDDNLSTDYNKVKSFAVAIFFDNVPTISYTVSFEKGRGIEGSMPSQTVEEGEYTLPSCDFTPPTSESFLGWAVGREDATPLKQPGNSRGTRDQCQHR